MAALTALKDATITKVAYDDGNVHLSLDNGFRISLATENFDESDYVWDDRPSSRVVANERAAVRAFVAVKSAARRS
jgi:hypothetical protein